MYVHAYMHTCIRAQMHTCTHTYSTYVRTYIVAQTFPHICFHYNPFCCISKHAVKAAPFAFPGPRQETAAGDKEVVALQRLPELLRASAWRGLRAYAPGRNLSEPEPVRGTTFPVLSWDTSFIHIHQLNHSIIQSFTHSVIQSFSHSVPWVWVKIKPLGDRRFQSMFPFTRVHFGYLFFTHSHFLSSVSDSSVVFQIWVFLMRPVICPLPCSPSFWVWTNFVVNKQLLDFFWPIHWIGSEFGDYFTGSFVGQGGEFPRLPPGLSGMNIHVWFVDQYLHVMSFKGLFRIELFHPQTVIFKTAIQLVSMIWRVPAPLLWGSLKREPTEQTRRLWWPWPPQPAARSRWPINLGKRQMCPPDHEQHWGEKQISHFLFFWWRERG